MCLYPLSVRLCPARGALGKVQRVFIGPFCVLCRERGDPSSAVRLAAAAQGTAAETLQVTFDSNLWTFGR